MVILGWIFVIVIATAMACVTLNEWIEKDEWLDKYK